MLILLRFRDLKERGYVSSWVQLYRLQKLHGFPLGRMLSPNARVWTEQEVDAWFASRPIDNIAPLRGALAQRARRKRAAAAAETSA